MFKKILLLTMAVFFITTTSFSPSLKVHAAESNDTGIIHNINSANVYKGPGKAYGTTGGKVLQGELVTIIKTSGNWTYFQSNDDYGWIASRFVQSSLGEAVLTNGKASHQLYSGPGTSFGKKGSAKAGATTILFEKSGSWRQIYVNGQEAWVAEKYIQPTYGVAKVKATHVNLYNGAGKQYGTSGKLDNGSVVAYAEVKNSWRHVFVNGKSYWIWNAHLTSTDYDSISHKTIISKNYANLYNGPAKVSGAKTKVNNGTPLVSLATMGSWTYIQTSSNEGWVWSDSLVDTTSTAKITGTSSAKIYKSPNKSGGTTGSLAKNKMVAISEIKNGWRSVRSSNTKGWIEDKYMNKTMKISSKSEGLSQSINNVNVYLSATKSLGLIGLIPKGSTVSYLDEKNGWRYIQAGNLQGWVWDNSLSTVSQLGGLTLIIDPGHGGTDPGAVGNGLKEAELTLDISERAQKLFDKTPINTSMTRTSKTSSVTANGSSISTSQSLQKRMDFAAANKKSDDDIFVSVHINAGGGTGGETYYYSSYSRAAVNPYNADSKLLAQKIQARLIDYMDFKNRGTKEANFYVLKYNSMPATLVEAGFIDNASDAAKLKQTYYKQQAAKAIYQGTLDYYKAKGFDVDAYNL
ncbi:N-acetylmuramoyl-L-alanine amidase [Peribacillus sp. NPDC097675]|uniref:N-acetylmuramoyl-L-alanine amidase n=1 Tax=Peribacillus sp. NPDC097675 TaxID=3390618 RepID=UPI003CFBCEEF